jgi:CTP:molybdopterin cytidylyltransferase MocA
MIVQGLLLAAGAGSRMGMPKALVADEHGPWLRRGVRALLEGGCAAVTVVLGAAVDDALPLLRQAPDPSGRDTAQGASADLVRRVSVAVAADWAEGMSASLRAGLGALEDTDADSALVHLVDLPDVGPDVVQRVIAAGAPLARASYDGVPGHPVLIGRAHWAPIVATATGDSGARDYLRTHDTVLVECGDLATGVDVDRR